MPKFKVVDSVTGNEPHAFYTAVDAQDAIEDYEAHDYAPRRVQVNNTRLHNWDPCSFRIKIGGNGEDKGELEFVIEDSAKKISLELVTVTPKVLLHIAKEVGVAGAIEVLESANKQGRGALVKFETTED